MTFDASLEPDRITGANRFEDVHVMNITRHSGARFDAVEKILYLKSAIKGDFRCFISTATGYGTVGVTHGQPFVEIVSGHIPYSKIEYVAAS